MNIAKFIFTLNLVSYFNALPYQKQQLLCTTLEKNLDVRVYSVSEISVLDNIVVKCESKNKGVMEFSAKVEPDKDSRLTVLIVTMKKGERKIMARKDVLVTNRRVTVKINVNNIKRIDQVSEVLLTEFTKIL